MQAPVRVATPQRHQDALFMQPSSGSTSSSSRSGLERAPKLWNEGSALHHLALPVCTFAGGPSVARHLAASSRALHHAVSEAWGDLVRRFPCRLYVAGGIDEDYRPLSTVERFDPRLGIWEAVPPMLSARTGASAASVAGRLYVVGGENNGRALRDAQRFDPWVGAWEALPPMSCARIGAATVVSDGYLYAIGGVDDRTRPLSSVERYDSRRRCWEAVPPMNRPRYACAAAVAGKRICVFGGELTDAGMIASAEEYDIETRVWELLPAVRAPVCNAAIALCGNMAYSVGGLSMSGQALGVAERVPLDKLAEESTAEAGEVHSWQQIPPMPSVHQARHLASTAVFRGAVVVLGGKGPNFNACSDVAIFDPQTRAWEALPPLPTPRIRAAVVGGCL